MTILHFAFPVRHFIQHILYFTIGLDEGVIDSDEIIPGEVLLKCDEHIARELMTLSIAKY